MVIGQHDDVTIREDGKVMVHSKDGDIAFGAARGSSGECGVQLGGGHLPNHVRCQIYFLQHGTRASPQSFAVAKLIKKWPLGSSLMG